MWSRIYLALIGSEHQQRAMYMLIVKANWSIATICDYAGNSIGISPLNFFRTPQFKFIISDIIKKFNSFSFDFLQNILHSLTVKKIYFIFWLYNRLQFWCRFHFNCLTKEIIQINENIFFVLIRRCNNPDLSRRIEETLN